MLLKCYKLTWDNVVAPRAGAWIETRKAPFFSDRCHGPVAPRAGAWIETRK